MKNEDTNDINLEVDEKLINEDEIENENTSKSKKNNKKNKQESSKKLEEKIAILSDQLLRNKAELENFKKRNNEERIKDRVYASVDLITNLLNPLDMLKQVVNIEQDNELLKNYLIGFKMISEQIFLTLEKDGLKEIDALNKSFDPKFHYAVEKTLDETKPSGIVLEVEQKGYIYKDKVIRPAMVKINE